MNNKIIVLVGIIGSIASIIGLLYLFLPKETEESIIQNQFGNNNVQAGEQVIVNNYTNQYNHTIDKTNNNEKEIFLSILNLITLGTDKDYVESLLGKGRKESNSKVTYIYSKSDFVVKIQYDKNKSITYIELIPKTLKFANQLDIGRFIYSDKPLFFGKATIGDFAENVFYMDENLEANSGGNGNCVNRAIFSYEYSTHRFANSYPVEIGYQANPCMDDIDLGKSNYITNHETDWLVHSSLIKDFELPDGTITIQIVDDPKILLEGLRKVNINYIAIGKFRDDFVD